MTTPDPRRNGGWIRVPLIGDPEGVVVMLPDQPLSEQNWQLLMDCLAAMKPGLVEHRTAAEEADRDHA